MTALLVAGYGWHQTDILSKASSGQNVAMARLLANTIAARHGAYLERAGTLDPEFLRARPETRTIAEEVRASLGDLPLLKLKFYHPTGVNVFSTNPVDIGSSKLDSPAFLEVVLSRQPRTVLSYRETMTTRLGELKNIHLAESYVPILDGAGKPRLIFELYSDISPAVAAISQGRWHVALATSIACLVLYALLLIIVGRADWILRLQHDQLIGLNASLAAERGRVDALNLELASKVRELERSNVDLHEFARIASHDLQEPLRKIEAFGSRLAGRFGSQLPEDGRLYLDRMMDATGRMRRLITGLLAYSRAGDTSSLQWTDLDAVMRDVLSDLQVRIEETGARVEIGPLPAIQAEPVQMRMLLQNLVANALKFRKGETTPTVKVVATTRSSSSERTAPDLVEIAVSDNGIGFTADQANTLFQLFQRLHGRSAYEGSGIGLATCRKIADRHGGTIRADGIAGVGATFTVTLPLGPSSGDAPFPPASGQRTERATPERATPLAAQAA